MKATYWLINNLVYCEDTHSFVHRLYDKIKQEEPINYLGAQHIANRILDEMWDEWEKKNGAE